MSFVASTNSNRVKCPGYVWQEKINLNMKNVIATYLQRGRRQRSIFVISSCWICLTQGLLTQLTSNKATHWLQDYKTTTLSFFPYCILFSLITSWNWLEVRILVIDSAVYVVPSSCCNYMFIDSNLSSSAKRKLISVVLQHLLFTVYIWLAMFSRI